jgi:hypothetical protein
MAYNNIFPVGYQYAAPQGAYLPPSTPVAAPQQPQGNMIWVSGEAGAKAYLVAPNSTVQLWDSESQTIYLKSADSSGMPTMKILDYTIREAQAQNTPTIIQDNMPEYVTKHDFDEFAERVQMQFDKMSTQKRRQRDKEDDNDE